MYKTILISCLLLLFVNDITVAQDSSYVDVEQHPEIRWVSQYPSVAGRNKKRNFFKRLGSFILGEKKAALIKPISVLALDSARFWVADQGNMAVAQVDETKRRHFRLLRNKKYNFSSIVGICAANDRQILVTDSRVNKIFSFTKGGKSLSVLNDSLLLKQPTGIAYSSVTDEIWVVETVAHRITVLDTFGRVLKTIGSRGTAPGQFNFPTFIWIDKKGNVYVVDSMNFRVQVFSPEGKLITVFGKLGNATGYFARPKGIATDSYGNIYVVDALFHVVQVFDMDGNFLYYFGGQGRNKEQFWIPCGIYIDDDNFIYVADSYNSRIQVFQLIRNE